MVNNSVTGVAAYEDPGYHYVEFMDSQFYGHQSVRFQLQPLTQQTKMGASSSQIYFSLFAGNFGYPYSEGYNEPARYKQGP